MDVAALLHAPDSGPDKRRPAAFAEAQVFAQILDAHLATDDLLPVQPTDDTTDDETTPADDPAVTEEARAPHSTAPAITALVAPSPDVAVALRPVATNAASVAIDRGTVEAPSPELIGKQALTIATGPGNPRPATATATPGPALHKPDILPTPLTPPTRVDPRGPGDIRPTDNIQVAARADVTSQPAAVKSPQAALLQDPRAPTQSLRAGRNEEMMRHLRHQVDGQTKLDLPKAVPAADNAAKPASPALPTSTNALPPQAAMPTATVDQPAAQLGLAIAGTVPTARGISVSDERLRLDLGAARAALGEPGAARQAKPSVRPAVPTASAKQPGEQVAMQIRHAAKAGADHIRIQLQPAELGKVDVQLNIQRDSIQAVITVERMETLDLLERDSRQLQQALKDAGFHTSHDSLAFHYGGEPGQQEQAASDTPADDLDTDLAVDAPAAGEQRNRHDGLLDMEA